MIYSVIVVILLIALILGVWLWCAIQLSGNISKNEKE